MIVLYEIVWKLNPTSVTIERVQVLQIEGGSTRIQSSLKKAEKLKFVINKTNVFYENS